MKEFVGIKDSLHGSFQSSALKREALIFNRIGWIMFDQATKQWESIKNEDNANNIANAQWLFERGFIFEPEISLQEETFAEDNDYRQMSRLEKKSRVQR